MITGIVRSLSGSSITGTVSDGAAKSSPAAMPFSGVLQSLVDQTSALDKQASEAVSGLLGGQGIEIHDAMIATQKADMTFELALQIRNKAVGAYQQMMNMQF
jgi:flagellar hook-basal body complex protein FliE